MPGGGGAPQRRQRVFDGGGGERDVRREHAVTCRGSGVLYGGWSAIRGECKRIQCPEEQLNGYAWLATNSSTEVRVPCSESMTGYVSRTCGATGVWSEPEDSCRTQMCDPVTINRMSNGCMNLKFEPEAATPCA